MRIALARVVARERQSRSGLAIGGRACALMCGEQPRAAQVALREEAVADAARGDEARDEALPGLKRLLAPLEALEDPGAVVKADGVLGKPLVSQSFTASARSSWPSP